MVQFLMEMSKNEVKEQAVFCELHIIMPNCIVVVCSHKTKESLALVNTSTNAHFLP